MTAHNPHIGYASASQFAREALETGRRVYDLVLEKDLMTTEQLDEVAKPEILTRPHAATGRPSAAKD